MSGARLLLLAVVVLLVPAGLLWRGAGAAQPLEADLSSHLVAITTGFTGSEVVLFGAVDGPGEIARRGCRLIVIEVVEQDRHGMAAFHRRQPAVRTAERFHRDLVALAQCHMRD